MSRVKAAVLAGCTAAAALTLAAAPAHAAPQGKVDPGIGFFSINHGVGCSYSMTVPVNASGMVSFYDWKGPGYKPLFIGRAMAQGGNAAVTWWPKRQGLRTIYAVQNGQRSTLTKVRVTQGYGSGGLCFAYP
ncbi:MULTISPECIES: hypothetical protein [unclassified Gordonia (in: high G+C Gram-positive bacteria)]|uniref:hypothetical protein n=1 Tax=unclassified Gordonia (in: high G+C Gram-positive bacteria) TaxID=2657482 RepID=UPI001FFE7732|nr:MULTISPECIES: hypothetical protein [unclassified Gordonia (in: high G+C Gram-positive bacteria)]UQE74882.1 hypothetical protein MYK68_19650 [Gordonia sp. PP30]